MSFVIARRVAHGARSVVALLLVGCLPVTVVLEGESKEGRVLIDTSLPAIPEELSIYKMEPVMLTKELEDALDRNDLDYIRNNNLPPTGLDKSTRKLIPSQRGTRRNAEFNDLHAELEKRNRLCTDNKELCDYSGKSSASSMKMLLKNEGLFPKDGSKISLGAELVLKHARVMRDEKSHNRYAPGRDAVVRVYRSYKRTIGTYSIEGPGSRFTAVFDVEGDMKGYSRQHFKIVDGSAKRERTALTPYTLRMAIEKQLSTLVLKADLHVRDIELIYYDSGSLLQPAFRFVAVTHQDDQGFGSPQRYVGYVTYAETSEPIPPIALSSKAASARQPQYSIHSKSMEEVGSTPETMQPTDAQGASSAIQPPLIRVGRYVTQRGSLTWQENANSFLSTLVTGASSRFKDEQYYYAEPYQFLERNAEFINQVDIALVEAHGFPYGFLTEPAPTRKLVNLYQIATDLQYGLSPGRLKHWIFHSCRTVPSPEEVQDWAGPWWGVFKGLHTVVGYRSAMYVDDGASAAFAAEIAAGEPIVSAWFTTVASLNIYHDLELNTECSFKVPIGRASAVTACGAVSSTVWSGPIEVIPNCLDAWWLTDPSLLEDGVLP